MLLSGIPEVACYYYYCYYYRYRYYYSRLLLLSPLLLPLLLADYTRVGRLDASQC
jgi:hypothetical protein